MTRNFDLRYAPTSIVVSGSQFTWNYTVDGTGNPTTIAQTLPATVNRTCGYQDTQYFLNSASGPWSGPLSWTYDRIGNRLTETRNSITDTYSYEANSGATGNTARLDVVNLGIGGTRDYTFDAGGFLDLIDLGANQVDFTFDAAGQLSQIARPVAGETLNLRYDGRGFLCDASDVVSGGYTQPTYSSQGVLMSLERLPDSAGTTEIHNVLYFAGLPVVLWKKVGTAASTRQFLVDDHLATPVYAFSTAGAALWNGGLEPFGKDWQEGTANDMLGKGIFLRFPGQWDDAVLANASLGAAIYYNVHRWYEAQSGRYTQVDPVGLDGGLNSFLYVNSNPIVLFDPFGEAYCTYSVTKKRLRCRPAFNPPSPVKQIEGPIFSGLGECTDNPECFEERDNGPVQPGIYRMNRDDRAGRDFWWRLERSDDPVSGFDYRTGRRRGGFVLHPGRRSTGCITIDKNDADAMRTFYDIHEMLLDEDGNNWLVVTR